MGASIAFVIGVVIYALKGWDVAEPWTFILSGGIPLFLSGIYLFFIRKPSTINNQINLQPLNSKIMTYKEVKELINKKDYSEVFDVLDEVYEKMPDRDKPTYNQLKNTLKQNMLGVNYDQQLKVFVSGVKSLLPAEGEKKAGGNDDSKGGGRTINTTNYFENSGTVNLDQKEDKKDDK